jgi:nucleoside-diphosphate-sugar epimerase
MLEYPAQLIAGETYNVGYQNYTVSELAQIVKDVVEREFPEKAPIRIQTQATDDNRSYHVSSRKIEQKLGFTPQRTLQDAVHDLCAAFKQGLCPDSMTDDRYVNVRTVKALALV